MLVRIACYLSILFSSFTAQSNQLDLDDLNISWTYHQIFHRDNIPAPTGDGLSVSGMYSPSVVKVEGKFYMLFGVSIACNEGTVARDSIAYASSPDGINNWTFLGYLIEPSNEVCTTPIADWTPNILYQVNDPTVVFRNDHFYVSYTSVHKDFPVHGVECGNIGTAIYSKEFELVYRNDKYLVPESSHCSANGKGGFSRPAYREITPVSTELWFDNSSEVYKVAVSSVTGLDPSTIESIGLVGVLDLDVFDIDSNTTMLLANHPAGVYYSYLIDGGVWSQWSALTTLSGQLPNWDSHGQGSPHFFIDLDDCASQLYLGGLVLDSQNQYDSIQIGVAIPRSGNLGEYICHYRQRQ